MSSLHFSTPVCYLNSPTTLDWITEKVDDYFYLGGKKAYVIQDGVAQARKDKVILSEAQSFFLLNICKLFSYCTLIIPITMLLLKVALRSPLIHQFKVIDLNKEAEENLKQQTNVEVAAFTIQRLLPKILKVQNDESIQYIKRHKIFKINGLNNVVIKLGVGNNSVRTRRGLKSMNNKELMEERFENMRKAREICAIHHLSCLVIPQAVKLSLKTPEGLECIAILEEEMDINPVESAQKEMYHTYSQDLDETARQLAIFIAKTGFNDVTHRNIPLMNEQPLFQGPRRVALIDLEHMESVQNGFSGDGNGSCGLIRCVSAQQIDLVINEARKQGIYIPDWMKKARLDEIRNDAKRREYHKQKGIVSGKEPLEVDLTTLDLNLEESAVVVIPKTQEGEEQEVVEGEEQEVVYETKNVTLGQIADFLIKSLNTLMTQKSDQESKFGQRDLFLNTNSDSLRLYKDLGLPNYVLVTSELEKQRWYDRILTALKDKGYLFEFQNYADGYSIQA